MTAKDNIHGGHRERLIDKFVSYPDSLSDHELLEMMLFSFIPRKNTNGIAHNLLSRFGTIENVFSCSPEELITIEGIGKKTAYAIALCGKLYRKTFEKRKTLPQNSWRYFVVYSDEIKPDFYDLTDEKLIVYFLTENFLLFYKLSFTDRLNSSVKMEMSELSEKLALKKPRYIIVAHNHPSGNPFPSYDDDITVKKLLLTCLANGCGFLDNLIYCNNNVYSYSIDRRFEKNLELAELYNTIQSLTEKPIGVVDKC